jgi:putative ABC transport system permease protein
MVSELKYVIRSLLNRKGFSLVTMLTLALGIGSATAIYSVVDWVLFRGPPSPPGLWR